MIPADNFTLGKTIIIAAAIYQKNWQKYLKLSLVAHLWLLVPIYGWARYFAIAAWVSRLGVQKLTGKPEPTIRKKYFAFSALIDFLITKFIIVFLINIFVLLVLYIVLFLILALDSNQLIFNAQVVDNSPLPFLFIDSLFYTFLYSRYFIVDPVQDKLEYLSSITQSYILTEKNRLRILLAIWLAFLITLPIWIINLFSLILLKDLIKNFISIRANIFVLTWIMLSNFLIMPFWQSVKAAVYYQLNPEYND